ncbi:MAG: hypothetical protein ABIZ36_10775 [Gemmatimonadaceae bacterium]
MIRSRIPLLTGIVAVLAATIPGAGYAQDSRPVIAAQQDGPTNPRRAQLEKQLRQRTGEMVRRRLGLNDEQMGKLQSTNRSFERQRTDLMVRERETRQALRAEMVAGDAANQAKVGQLLDQSIQLQRQRLDLLQSEQQELAKFLSPIQRARYFGIQNELRKRAQELRSGQGMRRRQGARAPLAGGTKR